MPTSVNYSTQKVINAAPRLLATGVRGVKLSANSTQFATSSGGTTTPSTITITATLSGISGAVTWEVISGTGTFSSTTDTTATLVPADLTTQAITVRATNGDYSDTITISKVVDGSVGSDAKLITLTTSSQVFQISKNNDISPPEIYLKAVRNNVTGATFSVIAGTATLTGISGDNATLVFGDMGTDAVTIKVTYASTLYSDTVTIVRVREGIDAVTGYLTNENVTLPASSSGVVSSYTGASGNFVVYYGSLNVTNSCTFSVLSNPNGLTPSGSIVTSGAGAGGYSITGGFTSDNATVTYRATYTNAFGTVYVVDKIFTLSKSKTGSTGAAGTDAKLMTLSASSQVFQVSKSNTVSPSSIALKAIRNNITGANFSVISGTATLTSVSGDDATLLYSNMSTDAVTVQVTDGTASYTDTMTIVKVREGVDAVTGYLTNEAVSLPADNSGDVLTYTGANGNFVVYYGSVDVTASCTFSVIANPNSLTPASSIVTSGVNAGTYSITGGFTTDTAAVKYRATYTNAFGNTYTVDKVFTLTKSKTGAQGNTGVTGAAARIAYVKTTGTLSATPSTWTISGDNLPTTGTWGEVNAWQTYPPTIAAGEQVWQTTGTYNYLTNQTTWVAPYLSNLKVGTLSALTIYTGTLEVDASGYIRGGQTAYNTGTGFWIGYSGGTYKFSIGSSTQGLTWDGAALTMTGKLQIGTAGLSGGAMTGSGAQINTDGTFALGTSTITSGSGGNGYDAVGGHLLYNGTEMVLNGIVKTSGVKGISFKSAGSTSGNTGNFTRVAGTESMVQVSRYAATSLPAVYIFDASTAGSTEALYITNNASFAGSSMVSFACNKGNALYMSSADTNYPTLELTNTTTTSVKGTAFFKNTGTGTEVSLGGGYPVYVAATKGKIYSTDGYLPFTGSHIVLLDNTVTPDLGDILCTDGVAYKEDVNNVFMRAKLSFEPNQKTRFGVYAGDVAFDAHIGMPYEVWWDLAIDYNTAVVNGVGEGQVNVCGEGGNIEAGDLIVTSSMQGKGMRGDDYTPVNRIVAQALESVTFSSPDEVKMIACVYMCS